MRDDMVRQARRVGDLSVEAGRGAGQLPWYEFASQFVQGKSVLDAGCGLGEGLRILQRAAREALGQDLDPRLSREDIMVKPLREFPSKSYDVVTSIDVVEHVEQDEEFIAQLCRIARDAVFGYHAELDHFAMPVALPPEGVHPQTARSSG